MSSVILQGLGSKNLMVQGYAAGYGNAQIILQGLLSPYLILEGYRETVDIPRFIPNNPNVFHVNQMGSSGWHVTKRSIESIPVDFDLSAALPTGVTVETIVSVTTIPTTAPLLIFSDVIVSDVASTYRSSNSTALAGQVVQITVSGGLPSTSPQAALLAPYSIQLVYTSTDGATREAVGCLAVINSLCAC